MPQRWTKDPDAVLDYTVDWETWLSGDTISADTWTVPSGITKDSDSNTTTTATIVLSGGTAGVIYPIICQILTAGGRTDQRTIYIKVAEK